MESLSLCLFPCLSFSSLERQSLTRPKSFVSTKLLTLEEAQARTQAPLLQLGAPLSFQGQFHTVLDLPEERRKRGFKSRKSAGGSWKTFFAMGKQGGSGRRKPMRISSLFQPSTSHAGCRVDSLTLRSAKSEESLSSQHSGAGQTKMQRLRRPRSSSDGLSLASPAQPELLSKQPPSRSYDSLLPDDPHAPGGDDANDDNADDEEGVYMLPDLSRDPASSWMAEDVVDFSPTFLEDGPIGLGSITGANRDSPNAAKSPPYRCVNHKGPSHSRSQSQRSVTEDPDSVLNQSEVAARRSLILAAVSPPVQMFLQHKPSAVAQHTEASSSPPHSQPVTASTSSHLSQERRSFTRKVVQALSPKAPKYPPLDISDPVAISVPAKVLEMIGGRAGELQLGPHSATPPQPPQMISMLLRSCDFQLTENCQQELRSKLGAEVKGQGILFSPSPVVPSQQPPPPPPKNPARLMALALAESANKALRGESISPPFCSPQFQESPSLMGPPADTDNVPTSPSDANQLYSTVRPLSAWMSEGKTNTADPQEGPQQAGSSQGPDTGTLSSQTSASDSGASNSEVSAGSSSGESNTSPGLVYKNQQQQQQQQAQHKIHSLFPEEQPNNDEASSQTKVPHYSRQFSAPHQQNKPSTQPQLLHSKSESSPLAQVHAVQPPRPKVFSRPLDQTPLSRADNFMRRSLDAARIRRIITQSQNPSAPLSRAFSERISGTSHVVPRYQASQLPSRSASTAMRPQAPQASKIQPIAATEDQGKMENFYYEIAAPEHPPPSYTRHSYQNMRLDAEGNYRPGNTEASQQPLSRVPPQKHSPHLSHVSMVTKGPQLWSSEVTRAWAAAQSHSHSFSHGHHRPQESSPMHHPLCHLSSSVRLSSNPAMGIPLSVHQRHQHRSQYSPSDLAASQLHPYFENGKVCYRHFEPFGAENHHSLAEMPVQSPSSLVLRPLPKQPEQSEPIYVNFPISSPIPASKTKSWATTDLDGDSQQSSDSLAPPSDVLADSSNPDAKQENPKRLASSSYDSPAQVEVEDGLVAKTTVAAVGHAQSRSDTQSATVDSSQKLTGKEIASLLIEKLAEDEGDGLCAVTSSSTSSSPPLEHPPNPYPSQHQHSYNVYTSGPFHSYLEGQAPLRGEAPGFQRPDPLRRSTSSGGHYRQAFDVMPSGDQVLKFYHAQDFNPNPYPVHPHYQDQFYTSQPSTENTLTSTSGLLTNLSLGTPRGFSAQPGGYPAVSYQHSQYPFQSAPMQAPYPSAPRREAVLNPSLQSSGLRSQRGLARQGSLPGPNWTVHSEGQTRSYC